MPTSLFRSQHEGVNHNMIVLARESRGLSQAALADQLGVTQGRVSKMESGLLAVPDEVLQKFTEVLDYPPSFFFQPGPLLGVGVAEVFHRKHQVVAKRLLNKVYASVEIRLRNIDALLRATEIEVNLPQMPVEDYQGGPAEIARLVRSTWNMPRGPVSDMVMQLEDAGIIVVEVMFETRKMDAISRWVPGLPPVFFINRDMPKDRSRFTLAHELGHMVMHKHPTPDLEAQAHQFASEFLMPERDVRADLLDLDLSKLVHLKQYWKVSMASLIYRAEAIGAISNNRARYLRVQMAKAGYTTVEPVELDPQGEHPTLLREVIEAHRTKLGYSVHDLQHLLALHEHDLWEYYFAEPTRGALRVVRRGANTDTFPETGRVTP